MAEREVVVGLVAIRAERRARTAMVLSWVAIALAVLSIALRIWRR